MTMTGVLWHSSGVSIIPRETDIDWDEWESQSGLGLEPAVLAPSGHLEQFQGQADTTTEPATEPPVMDPSSSTSSLSTVTVPLTDPTDTAGTDSTTVVPTISETPATTTNPSTVQTDATTPTSAETEPGSTTTTAITETTDPGNPTTPGTIQTDATSPTSPQTTTLPGSIATITATESSTAPSSTIAGPISSEASPTTSSPGSTSTLTSSSLSSESPAPPSTTTVTDSSTVTPTAPSISTSTTEAPAAQESTTSTPSTPTLTTTPAPAVCKCGAGIPRLSNLSKIVGGVSARNHAWPWMAIIVTGNGALCGGSLINSLYVLTAAHCVDRLDSSQIGSSAVILGRNRVITNTTSRALRRIASVGGISVHPLYNISGFAPYNDIALIKLSSPVVVFSDFIKPICLGQSGAPFTGRQALVTGWGKVNESSTHSNSLREAKVTVISNEECNATYPYIIRHTHVCAYRPPHDACNGDSGGPLIVLKDKDLGSISTSTSTPDPDDGIEYFTQIGIVSFGRGCGQVGSPGVYTRVEKFLNWIRAKTRGSGATYCGDSFA